MKPYSINLINGVVLILLGSWAFITSETPSVTALIPVFVGVVLVVIAPGFKKGNRVLAHIAVILTSLILVGLIKPLTGAIGRQDIPGIARVLIMMITSLASMIVFIRSFIDARKSSKKIE